MSGNFSDFILRGRLYNKLGQTDKIIRVADDNMLLSADRYAEYAARGQVYTASNAAFTMPVNAATLATKFALYNPPGSGVFLDVMDAEVHAVVATTVVDAVGLYYSSGSNATTATFTTKGTIENARVGEGITPQGQFWSVAVHVGTPALLDFLGGWGAVTDGGATPIRKDLKGKILIPPSTLVSLAMTTAASTGSGITAQIRWAEIPYVNM